MDAWIMIIAVVVVGIVIGKLLYELNPAAWKSAAARVEDDTPPDGAIDDYLEWVEERDEIDWADAYRRTVFSSTRPAVPDPKVGHNGSFYFFGKHLV